MILGLLRRMSNIDSRIIAEKNKLFEEFKGAFTENFVFNTLNTLYENSINYFTFDRYEIDFIVQVKNEIIPIEVKSNKSTNNTSLTRYNNKNTNRLSIRLSMNNLCQNEKVLNIPLFMTEYLGNLI